MRIRETSLCRPLAGGIFFDWSWLPFFAMAILLVAVAGMLSTASLAQSPKVAGRPSPTPLPSPPVIEFQAVPATDLVERGEQTLVFLLISNKSEKSVRVSTVVLASTSFIADPLVINSDLPAFRSLQKQLVIKAKDDAAFKASKSVLSLEYSWDFGGTPTPSIQRADLSMEVRRRFDEEAKGLPGGTAAFLYLLLPILPALLAYQLINRRRLNEGWNMPTLGADQIVPAFFMAVIFSFVLLLIAKKNYEINYSEPRVFVIVLVLSAAAGVLIPGIRWLIDSIRWRLSGFNDEDTRDGKKYLSKALRQCSTFGKLIWTTGKIGEVKWQGIRLKQPNGTLVLGATVQIAGSNKLKEDWATTKKKILSDKGLDAAYLKRLLKKGMVDVAILKKIQVDTASRNEFVVIDEVKGFQDQGAGAESDLLRMS
jgi:hypothetical protein